MGRRRSLQILAACAAGALAATAHAAEITRVVSSAEPDHPFGMDVSARYEHGLHRAKIAQEVPGGPDQTELFYEQTTNQLVPRVAVGLYRDLELHAEMPYVFNDDHFWRYAAGAPRPSSIETNAVDANGAPCPAPCPIFPVAPSQTVYHGGRLGDLVLGLAWGIFSDRRDDTKPTWVVGADVTFPTAERYDPTTGLAEHSVSGNAAPIGQKIWMYDFYTALSKRMGPVDPYVKAHVRLSQRSGTTYSNCEHLATLAAETPKQANDAFGNCSVAPWRDGAGAEPPTVIGILFGTELVPFEDRGEKQKVAFDLRAGADYVTGGRWYNELSDATGKLLQTQRYVAFTGLAGFYLRASEFFLLRATASFEYDLAHFLTGEPPTKNGVPNPNFDFRYDLPGRRFRIVEDTNFTLAASGTLSF